jgi:hypothetical protein
VNEAPRITIPVLVRVVALGIALLTQRLRDVPATPLDLKPDLVAQIGKQ